MGNDLSTVDAAGITALGQFGGGVAAGAAVGGPFGAVIGGLVGLGEGISTAIHASEQVSADERAAQRAKDQADYENVLKNQQMAIQDSVKGAYGPAQQAASLAFLQGIQSGNTLNGAMSQANVVQGYTQASLSRGQGALDKYGAAMNGGLSPSLMTRITDPLTASTAMSARSNSYGGLLRSQNIAAAPQRYFQDKMGGGVSIGTSADGSSGTSANPAVVNVDTSSGPALVNSLQARVRGGGVNTAQGQSETGMYATSN